MLEIARSRFPELTFHSGDMASMDIGKQFDGIIAWNSFFHLTQDAQREALKRFGDHLAPGGVLMLTVGGEAGELIGHVNGAEVYHSSLSPEEYRERLRRLDIEVVEFVVDDEECGQQTVLLAQKSS